MSFCCSPFSGVARCGCGYPASPTRRFVFGFRFGGLVLGLLLSLLLMAVSDRAQAQTVGKGHLILMDRGLQLQGLSQDDCYLHLDTFSNANYTSIAWINSPNPSGHSSRPDWMGPAPGFLWSRWAADETQMPPQITPYGGDETPNMSQLFALQLGDEWNLNDDTVRTRLVDWFNSVQANFPNVILYHNNWGSQIGDAPLADFIARALPDMVCFDTYPWQSVWDGNQPDHTGPPIAGPPTGWYGDLRRNREHARGAGIPLAIYRQTFHAVQDYDNHVFRDPSPSELRLNTFGALAFNAKLLTDFVYNTGAASLFTKTFNGSGDTLTNSNGLYAEMTDVNNRARNLGKALVYLTPIYDIHNQNNANPPSGPASSDPCACLANSITTSIMFLQGRIMNGAVTNATPLPISFQSDPASSAVPGNPQNLIYSWWESDKNDPYLRGWAVTNKAAVNNNGLPGDVILSWFTPMDESLDGSTYSNQVYMMVVNGLTSPTGTAADCLQQIRLNFLNTTATTTVDMLNPTNGQIQTISLPVVSTRRQLVLELNGGDAALFKFSTGAPFVGFLPLQPAKLSAQLQAGAPAITIQGTVGTRYLWQRASSPVSTNWTTVTNLLLPSASYTYVDAAPPAGGASFYRAMATK
jgi:hypothetical protein